MAVLKKAKKVIIYPNAPLMLYLHVFLAIRFPDYKHLKFFI